MTIHDLAAAAPACNTGNWVQQFKCGYDLGRYGKAPTVAHAFVHGVLPVLVIAAFIVFLVIVNRWERRKKLAAQPAPARVPRYARR